MPERLIASRVTFLSKPWGTKAILLGLSIHFALWWAFSAWLWRSWLFGNGFGFSFWSSLTQIVVAPVYLGIFYLHPRSLLFWEWGAAGILVSLALITMIFFSLRTRHGWAVMVTHFVVVLYWLVGLALVASGE